MSTHLSWRVHNLVLVVIFLARKGMSADDAGRGKARLVQCGRVVSQRVEWSCWRGRRQLAGHDGRTGSDVSGRMNVGHVLLQRNQRSWSAELFATVRAPRHRLAMVTGCGQSTQERLSGLAQTNSGES